MTLHQFRIFLAIAKCGNLTKAALQLRMSQPAISHQLKLLQGSYGARIYLRTPAGIELTHAGRKLLAGIAPIVEQVAKLKRGFEPVLAPKEALELLRVGGIESASGYLLPAILAQFKRRYPNVGLDFRTRTSEQLERLVLNFALDFAVTGRDASSNGLVCEPLRQERVALFVSANHPLAKRPKVSLTDALAEPLIVSGSKGGYGVTDSALRQLRNQGHELKIGMRCDGPTAIKATVRQKMGVGIVFEASLRSEVASGEFKILKVSGLELTGESFITYSRHRPLGPVAREFLELLRGAATSRRKAGELGVRLVRPRMPQQLLAVGDLQT
ncbi:MAG TPA: LysR family transcriptional regulator [Acidobacteriota bacterium]|nr:LysR family transcriptional regulator [Acidobacteriota bacterium]